MDFHKLVHAVQHSDVSWFLREQRLSKCLLVSHKKTGDTVLHLVCRFGRRDLLQQFSLCEDADLEIANYEGKKPLHEAAQFGQLDCVEFLLQNGVQVDCLKRADWTPLMLACTKCQLSVISVLLKHGADPSLLNKDAWNSFHIAAREGHVEILQTLLGQNSALWNTVSHNGRTPLHTAALHGHVETVRFLLSQCDYSADASDSCGVTPLMDALHAGFVDVAALLISWHKGLAFDGCVQADVNRQDSLGRQAIHHAAQAGQLTAVDFLLSTCKVPVDIATPESCITSLHIAAKEGQDTVIRLLIQKGADVNRVDSKGRTGSYHQSKDQAHKLKHEGCFLILPFQSNKELSPAESTICLHSGDRKLAGSKQIVDCAALHIASAAQHASTMQLLLASGSLDTPNSEGQLAPHLASPQHLKRM